MEYGEYKGFYYAFGSCDSLKDGFLPIRPECVFGPRHLKASVMTAIDAFLSGRSVARDLNIEFLVRLSGNRQISKARECLASNGPAVLVWISKESPPRLDCQDVKSREGELDAIERRLLI